MHAETACVPGKYYPGYGYNCAFCPLGKASAVYAASSEAACQACAPGQYSDLSDPAHGLYLRAMPRSRATLPRTKPFEISFLKFVRCPCGGKPTTSANAEGTARHCQRRHQSEAKGSSATPCSYACGFCYYAARSSPAHLPSARNPSTSVMQVSRSGKGGGTCLQLSCLSALRFRGLRATRGPGHDQPSSGYAARRPWYTQGEQPICLVAVLPTRGDSL